MSIALSSSLSTHILAGTAGIQESCSTGVCKSGNRFRSSTGTGTGCSSTLYCRSGRARGCCSSCCTGSCTCPGTASRSSRGTGSSAADRVCCSRGISTSCRWCTAGSSRTSGSRGRPPAVAEAPRRCLAGRLLRKERKAN